MAAQQQTKTEIKVVLEGEVVVSRSYHPSALLADSLDTAVDKAAQEFGSSLTPQKVVYTYDGFRVQRRMTPEGKLAGCVGSQPITVTVQLQPSNAQQLPQLFSVQPLDGSWEDQTEIQPKPIGPLLPRFLAEFERVQEQLDFLAKPRVREIAANVMAMAAGEAHTLASDPGFLLKLVDCKLADQRVAGLRNTTSDDFVTTVNQVYSHSNNGVAYSDVLAVLDSEVESVQPLVSTGVRHTCTDKCWALDHYVELKQAFQLTLNPAAQQLQGDAERGDDRRSRSRRRRRRRRRQQ